MEFTKEEMKDVVAVAEHFLRDCKPDAPGPFMLADQENAVLWLTTIVTLGKVVDWNKVKTYGQI